MAKLTTLTDEEKAVVAVVVRELNKLIERANADALAMNAEAPQLPLETPTTLMQKAVDGLFAGWRAQADEVETAAPIREAMKDATPEQLAAIKELLGVVPEG
jgi:hypothetical protein